MTGSGVMTIFAYKGLTRNLEIEITAQFMEIGASYEYQIWHEFLQ